jgi:hypothetical protein
MKKIFIAIVLTIPILSGCYYDNMDEIHPSLDVVCDTTGTITYTNDIAPILSSKCGSQDIACHKAGNVPDIILDTPGDVHNYVLDGSLMGSILHKAGFKPMPKGGGSLDDCSIQKIQAWINRNEPL